MDLAWFAAAGGLLGGWTRYGLCKKELVSSGWFLDSSGWKWVDWIAGILGGITFGPGGALYGVFAEVGPLELTGSVVIGFIGGYLSSSLFDEFLLIQSRFRPMMRGAAAKGVVR